MEVFLPDDVQTILLGLIAIALVLGGLARKFPHVAWLRIFRLPEPAWSEEEKARRKRAGNRKAAIEIVLVGFALPFLYLLSTVVMFQGVETMAMILVGAGSLSCFVLGTWIFLRNRER
jgi:hypothetical protein